MANLPEQNPRTLFVSASDPPIEAAGSQYYNTTDLVVKTSNGTIWVAPSAGASRTFPFFIS